MRGFPFFRRARETSTRLLEDSEERDDHNDQQDSTESIPLLFKWMGPQGYDRLRREFSLHNIPSLLAMSAMFFSIHYVLGYFWDGAVQKMPLELAQGDTFHIAVFADLHYGENENSFGIEQDRKSTALMRQILLAENPDFVVLNGDLITGENTFDFNSTDYVDQIVAPLVEEGYLWASTYGNHDSKYNLSREALYNREKTHTGSYTDHGPSGTDGVTNYFLPLYGFDSSESNPEPVALLWFFDSRGGAEYQHLPANEDNISNHVSNDTVLWYRQTQADLQRKFGILPSLAFVHIPFHAFLDLQTQGSPGVSTSWYPGLNADVPLAQQGYSNTGEESVPLMKALLDTPGLHSVYSAHDHENSWCGRWPDDSLPGYGVGGGSSKKRPLLCFCKHSGYGGYGTSNRGVRQVRLAFDADGVMTVDTWVRMQSGRMVTAVSLNETYGDDVYSTVDGE